LTRNFGFALLAACGLNCLAAEPPVGATPAVVSPVAAPRDTMAAAAVNDESAAKKRILESPAWQQAVQGFHDWLSVQVVYDQEEIPQLEKQFRDKVDKMSASQLQGFLADLQQKLKIMNGQQAMEARAWAEDYLSKFTPAAAEKFRRTLPDVANMNAAQLQQALYGLQQRQQGDAAGQRAFDQVRDQQVAAIRQKNLLSAEADAEANAQMSSSLGGYYSGYSGNNAAANAALKYDDYYPGSNVGIYAPLRYPGFASVFPGYLGGWRW